MQRRGMKASKGGGGGGLLLLLLAVAMGLRCVRYLSNARCQWDGPFGRVGDCALPVPVRSSSSDVRAVTRQR